MSRTAIAISRARPNMQRRSFTSIMADMFAALLGLSTSFVVHIVGDLPTVELIVIMTVVPLVIIYRRRAFRRDVIPIFLLMGGWLINQILTDIYRHTATRDWVRGDAAIGFFAIDLIVVFVLIAANEQRRLILLTAYAIGSVLAYRFQPTDFSIAAPWKFGLSTGVNLLAVLVGCYFFNKRHYLVTFAVLLGICSINLLFNYRSPVLFLLLTIVLAVPVIPERIGRWRILPPQGTRMRLVVLVVLALGASAASQTAVKVLARGGYLGEDAQRKNEIESHVKGGLLIGGRPEILVSSRAILDSPILGHGSWAKDYKYALMLNDTLIENGMDIDANGDDIEANSEGIIPAHSHIMGAWVWAGIAGGVFWIYIFWITLKAVIRVAITRPAFAPLYTYLFVTLLWDILFSPFGSTRRFTESVIITIALDLLLTHGQVTAHVRRFRSRTWRRGQFQSMPPAAARMY